jgi:lipoprotein-anchoring transpeptidase ErfK/SrfK
VNPRLLLASGVLAIAVIVGVFALSSSEPAAPPSPHAVAAAPARPAPKPAPQPSALPKDEPFVIKRILPIKGAIKYGEWHWDEANVPAGPIVMTVDLDARVISVFRGGYEIGTSAVLLGTGDTPTPLGVFPITEKDKDHVSNIYTGAPMPYMQRLTNDGITLHGSNVELGYASHGCVGMPVDFAAKLFGTTKIGDKVYITRGKQVGLGDDLAGG